MLEQNSPFGKSATQRLLLHSLVGVKTPVNAEVYERWNFDVDFSLKVVLLPEILDPHRVY